MERDDFHPRESKEHNPFSSSRELGYNVLRMHESTDNIEQAKPLSILDISVSGHKVQLLLWSKRVAGVRIIFPENTAVLHPSLKETVTAKLEGRDPHVTLEWHMIRLEFQVLNDSEEENLARVFGESLYSAIVPLNDASLEIRIGDFNTAADRLETGPVPFE